MSSATIATSLPSVVKFNEEEEEEEEEPETRGEELDPEAAVAVRRSDVALKRIDIRATKRFLEEHRDVLNSRLERIAEMNLLDRDSMANLTEVEQLLREKVRANDTKDFKQKFYQCIMQMYNMKYGELIQELDLTNWLSFCVGGCIGMSWTELMLRINEDEKNKTGVTTYDISDASNYSISIGKPKTSSFFENYTKVFKIGKLVDVIAPQTLMMLDMTLAQTDMTVHQSGNAQGPIVVRGVRVTFARNIVFSFTMNNISKTAVATYVSTPYLTNSDFGQAMHTCTGLPYDGSFKMGMKKNLLTVNLLDPSETIKSAMYDGNATHLHLALSKTMDVCGETTNTCRPKIWPSTHFHIATIWN